MFHHLVATKFWYSDAGTPFQTTWDSCTWGEAPSCVRDYSEDNKINEIPDDVGISIAECPRCKQPERDSLKAHIAPILLKFGSKFPCPVKDHSSKSSHTYLPSPHFCHCPVASQVMPLQPGLYGASHARSLKDLSKLNASRRVLQRLYNWRTTLPSRDSRRCTKSNASTSIGSTHSSLLRGIKRGQQRFGHLPQYHLHQFLPSSKIQTTSSIYDGQRRS